MSEDPDDIAGDPTLLLSEAQGASGSLSTSGPITGNSGMIADRYEVIALLGVGGMGHVYKARDTHLDEVVALKTLNEELSRNPDAIDRFRTEVRLARRVTHPNVARTYDIGQFNGHYFLTMELVDGETLDQRVRRKPALKLRAAIAILLDVARGLDAAHRVGVVHRDLKPQNVLVSVEGRVLISDFGIARANEVSSHATGSALLGTPAYMSPEQVQGVADIDGRADLFALGVMMFELMTGKLPWSAPTPLATALSRVVDPPLALSELRPDIPGPLREAVERCLAVDREARFASVREWIDAVSELTHLDEESEASIVDAGASSTSHTGRTPRQTKSERTVAVIPFSWRGEHDSDHLADGLTEEIIDELSMSPGLKVRPRGVVAAIDASAQDPQAIGRQLGVQVVVRGSVQMREDRLRVRVALISVEDGFQLWAHRFEGTAADLFDMGIDVAEAVTAALLVEHSGSPRMEQADPVAVDLYMRARQEMHLAWHGDISTAIGLFEAALARAPEDPRILAGAATAYARAGSLFPQEIDRYLELAENAAREAIRRFPKLPEAHIAQSTVHRIRGDRAAALRLAYEVLELAPGHVDAQFMVGQTLLETGPLDKGIAYLEAVRRAAPNLPHLRIELSRARALRGEWDDVDSLLSLPEALLGSSAGVFALTRARLDLWRPGPPRWLGEPAAEGFGHQGVEQVTTMMRGLRDGQRIELGDSQVWVDEARRQQRQNWFLAVMHQVIAEMLAYSEQIDETLDQITAASDAGSYDVVWLRHCPLFADLHDDARYVALLQEFETRAAAIRGDSL